MVRTSDIAMNQTLHPEFELENFKFYGIVRDPIERFVSAYKDKIGRRSLQRGMSRQYYWERNGTLRKYNKNID